jgi:hypothetical protein
MSRFSMTLAAAAASATAAIAAVALPAVGADAPKTPRSQAPPGVDVAALVSCLRSHGLADAPTDPNALKPWLRARQASDPDGVKGAMLACDDKLPDEKRAAPGPDFQQLVTCVRAHGLDAPTAPDAFKRWLAEKEAADRDTLYRVMGACKMALGPGPDVPAKPGGCGDDVRPTDKAAKPGAAKQGAAEAGI